MATKYLKLRPKPGKWYISQGWQSGGKGPDGVELSAHQHDGQLSQMLLAGPFETRGEAETWNTKHADGHAAVWQG
jgi:hypothetical protein